MENITLVGSPVEEFLDKVADTIADMEPLPDEWPQYRCERLICRNGLKPLINMALYHAEHNDRPWDYREKCDPLKTSSFIRDLVGLRWHSENFACAVGGRIRDYHRALKASRLPQ